MARYVLNLDTNELQPLPAHQERRFRSQIGKTRFQARGLTDERIKDIYEQNNFNNIAIFDDRNKAERWRTNIRDTGQELTRRRIPIPQIITRNRLRIEKQFDNLRRYIQQIRDREEPEAEIWQILMEDYNASTGVMTNITVFVEETDLELALTEMENWEATAGFEFETQPVIGEINVNLEVIFWTNRREQSEFTYEYDLWIKERLN